MSRFYQKPSYILFERPVGSKCWTMCFKSRDVPFHASKLQTAINETRTRRERDKKMRRKIDYCVVPVTCLPK